MGYRLESDDVLMTVMMMMVMTVMVMMMDKLMVEKPPRNHVPT